MIRILTITIQIVLYSMLTSFSMARETNITKLTLIPQWVPQAQFAGLYVALYKEFYKNKGIDLTIIPGGPDRPSSEFLKENKADIATMWLSTAIQKRDEGVKLINIAQLIGKSALILVAKKESGIESPEDMNGKKVGLWEREFSLQPEAFFKKYNLTVKTIPQSKTMNLFLRDGVDVASAMWYNEYHILLDSGLNPDELTTFFFFDHDLNFPEDGIYVLEETYKENPELICSFVTASLQGWDYAFNEMEEALDIVIHYMKESKIPANRIHQKWMLLRMKDLIISQIENSKRWTLSENEYMKVSNILIETELIQKIPDYNLFHKKCDL